MPDGQLLGIDEAARWAWIPNEYEDIRRFIGNWIDICGGYGPVSAFVDDEGMLNSRQFNVVASIAVGRPVFGPAVLTADQPDDEGNTLPPDEGAAHAFIELAKIWHNVVTEASRLGQDLTIVAQADTLPPPQIVEMSKEQFERYLLTGEVPVDE